MGRAKSELLTRLIGDGYPELRIVSAKILVVEKPEQFCDATYHARYTCHGRPIEDTDPLKEVGKCMFEVNEAAKICRLPGFTEQPMLYTVDFICGDSAKQETIDVPFGGTAYLTCR